MKHRLLIMSCSQKKRALDERDQAWRVYDGPLWQTLRTVDPKRNKATVMFLSAKHGLKSVESCIEPYDLRMTDEIADELVATGLNRPWYDHGPGRHPHYMAQAFYIAHDGRRSPFTEICLVGGELYLSVMRPLVEEAQLRMPKRVADDARIVEINGPIGYMRQELRAWLLGNEKARRVRPGLMGSVEGGSGEPYPGELGTSCTPPVDHPTGF